LVACNSEVPGEPYHDTLLEIEGIVRSQVDSVPVAGAEVTLSYYWGFHTGTTEFASVEADAQGRYSISYLEDNNICHPANQRDETFILSASGGSTRGFECCAYAEAWCTESRQEIDLYLTPW